MPRAAAAASRLPSSPSSRQRPRGADFAEEGLCELPRGSARGPSKRLYSVGLTLFGGTSPLVLDATLNHKLDGPFDGLSSLASSDGAYVEAYSAAFAVGLSVPLGTPPANLLTGTGLGASSGGVGDWTREARRICKSSCPRSA